MSDVRDESLSLPIEQRVMLWSMRAIVLEMRRPSGLHARVSDMLDRFGVPGAAPYMQGFMRALSCSAARMIEIQCVCCTRIGADEQALLDVLGLAQDERPFEALLALHGLVTPPGARAALGHAEALGAALAQAGRFLPAPDMEMRHYALSSAPSAWPACATVH